ncbi:FAD-dependent oxidoreductase [Paenibacillus popilliae]|uniref:FAD-dependent oxidoreductase n=1 Tax=Paenibacillus popilliae TaxID=78057 RepID=A0ABY3AKF1_PAEPP|nr:FAD-dependent oxidoreductase [Paenibacillus sp. SDF0028]TQR42701.1 FAD-dependent oxidoreductase [Paenibacillus sp. SDF0028]
MNYVQKGIHALFSILIAALFTHTITPASSAQASFQSRCGTLCSHYDIVVIGSEIQGILLAKAAHDHGLNVLILDPRSKPGGELIEGEMWFLDEPFDKHGHSLVQGSIKPLFDGYDKGTIRKPVEFENYYEHLIQGIPLRSSIAIQSVQFELEKKEKSIHSLTYTATDGKIYTVQSKYWVENTDFSALTSKLDEKRIPGMESLYDGKNNKPDYMAATLMLKFKHVNWSMLHQAVLASYPLQNLIKKYGPNTYVDGSEATGFSNIMRTYKPHDNGLMLRGMNTVYQRNGEAIMNALLVYNVDPANPASVQAALYRAKTEAPYILNFLRQHIWGFSKAELNGFPDYLYIRDYNRFETKYVLNEHDILNGNMFWDNVSIGGYSLDLQGTTRIREGIGFGQPDRYGIPLRSFLLKSYDNVIVAGKNIGATIKAYGSARIMPNTALAAEAIGIILGKERSKPLAELTPDDFKRIHYYLQTKYHIVLDK